jgi:hypothetical protein
VHTVSCCCVWSRGAPVDGRRGMYQGNIMTSRSPGRLSASRSSSRPMCVSDRQLSNLGFPPERWCSPGFKLQRRHTPTHRSSRLHSSPGRAKRDLHGFGVH